MFACRKLLLNFECVALLANVEALRGAETIAHACGFVNVTAKKDRRFFLLDPGAKRGAAGVLAGSVFV